MKDLCIHLPASLTRNICSKQAEIPGYFCQQICWGSVNLPADLVAFSKFASRFGGSQEICQQNYPSISARRFVDSQEICWLNTPQFCCQIWWHSVNLPADLVAVRKSASRTTPPFLPGRFVDSQEICWLNTPQFCHQICWQSVNFASRFSDSPNLLANLLTVSKNPPISTGRFEYMKDLYPQG